MNRVYYCIDWLQATTDFVKGSEVTIIDRAQKIFGDVEWQEGRRAQRPYTNVVECEYASIHWNPQHPEFKYLLRMSGQQLEAYRSAGNDVLRVLRYLEQYHFTVTRIDLARDIFDRPVKPASLYNAWRMGELQTTARKVTIVQSMTDEGSDGETVYFGGRTSNRYLRVYDKAKQANFNGLWVRAEFEIKSDNAVVVANQLMAHGVANMFQTLLHSAIIKGLPEWLKDGDSTEIIALEAVPRKVTNTEKWLFDVVVPAVYKGLAAGVPGLREALDKILADESLEHGATSA